MKLVVHARASLEHYKYKLIGSYEIMSMTTHVYFILYNQVPGINVSSCIDLNKMFCGWTLKYISGALSVFPPFRNNGGGRG